jgi:hypothetical protein
MKETKNHVDNGQGMNQVLSACAQLNGVMDHYCQTNVPSVIPDRLSILNCETRFLWTSVSAFILLTDRR